MHGGFASYICPNCGVSVLHESKGCKLHVSPFVGMSGREQTESATAFQKEAPSDRIDVSSIELIATAFVSRTGTLLCDLLDSRKNPRSRYYRRMFCYIVYVHSTIRGKRTRFRDLSSYLGISIPAVQGDVRKFRELLVLKSTEGVRTEQVLQHLRNAFHS